MPLPLRSSYPRECFNIAVVPFYSGSCRRLHDPAYYSRANPVAAALPYASVAFPFPFVALCGSIPTAETDVPKFTRLGSASQLASQDPFPHPHLSPPTNRVQKQRAYARTFRRKGQPVTGTFPPASIAFTISARSKLAADFPGKPVPPASRLHQPHLLVASSCSLEIQSRQRTARMFEGLTPFPLGLTHCNKMRLACQGGVDNLASFTRS